MQRSKRKAGKGALELLSGADSDDFEEAPARAPKAMKSDKVEKVRVWWPPTKDKDRTGFSGAYWPASVHRKGTNFLEVEYDNGEREKVDPDNIFPFDVPIEFGKETTPLMVGEFVEVSNNSKTDPCAWLGCVATLGKKCLIKYPFHDSPDELIKLELLRRARVWDDLDWKYIDINQRWKAGEVTSPIELNLLTEEEYYKHLKQLGGKVSGGKGSRGKKPAAAAAAPRSESEGSDSQQEDSSSGEEQQQPQPKKQSSTGRQRGRPRKPQHPTRSMLDEASNGTRERKEEKPTGARKRKPAAVRQAPANANSNSKEKDARQQQREEQPSDTPAAPTPATAIKNAAALAVAAANKAAGTAAAVAAADKAAGKAGDAGAAAAGAAASGSPGSAAAPVTLTALMQGLSQPVLLLPAAAGQQTPMMLLLPKGTDPAGLGFGRGAGAVALQGAAAAAAAGVAAGRGVGAGGAGAPGTGNSQSSSGAAAARAGVLQQQAQPAAAAPPLAALSPRGPPGMLNLFPAGTSQAAAAAEIDSQLALLDLTAARLALAQRYSSEAYLLLVDCWRAESARLPDALRSFRANVLSCPQPDYQAFMVGIFGMQRMKELELQQQ